MRGRLPRVGLAAIATAVVLAHAGGALAQEPNQVTGLAADQEDGFVALSWDPVQGATDYQIERTPVDEADRPTGPATIVGLWQPTRTVTQTPRRSPSPASFSANASAGAYGRGSRRWRSRFVAGLRNDEPAVGGGARCFAANTVRADERGVVTSDVDEYLYTAALDAASERVRVVEIGRTLQGRPINMFIFGHPEPLQSAAQISESPTTLIQCHVHGNEPSMRESCLILARELAFTDDPDLLEIMERSTVLIVPTLNGDGRAADTRGSSTFQDLNRDHSLLREPETKAFSAMLRDYTRTSQSTVTTGTTRIYRSSGRAISTSSRDSIPRPRTGWSRVGSTTTPRSPVGTQGRTATAARAGDHPPEHVRAPEHSSGSCPRIAPTREPPGRARPSRATKTGSRTVSSGSPSSCSNTTSTTTPRSGVWSLSRAHSREPTSAR